MFSVQNLACIEAYINPSDKRILLNKDSLRGKKILAMYIFSSTEDFVIKSPYHDEMITQINDISTLSLFMNLQDKEGNLFIKDFCFDYFTMDTENSYNQGFIEYKINRVLDLDNCYITYKGDKDATIKILVYVLYQTMNFIPLSDEVNGSITVDIPILSESFDLKLSDLFQNALKGKQIKQILITGRNAQPIKGYLDIVAYRKRIENIPACLLQIHTQKEFRLDFLDIDYEKSYYRHRATLNYDEKYQMTLIY